MDSNSLDHFERELFFILSFSALIRSVVFWGSKLDRRREVPEEEGDISFYYFQ